MKRTTIYCCTCEKDVKAALVTGADVYPHRSDLENIPFWRCKDCGQWVGTHHRDKKNRLKPLGVIATPAIKTARQHIHFILDPIWKMRRMARRELYAEIGKRLGREYHTAEIRSLDEAREVYKIVREINKEAFDGFELGGQS